MNARNPIVKVEHLHKWFGLLHVLRDVSFSVTPQEVLVLIGRSGSGKSTLLRCLNLLEEPSSGSITINDVNVNLAPGDIVNRKEAKSLRLQTGMVFQEFNLFPHMTALENVIEGLVTVNKMRKDRAIQIGEKYLDKVGLLEKRDVHPVRLSGGQKQRVAIARSLAIEPKVLLFDEPTSALDPELIGEVLAVMKQLALEGTTMIVVTHEMSFASNVADTVMYIQDGEIIEEGPPEQLFNSPRDERTSFFLRSFLEGRNMGDNLEQTTQLLVGS